MNYPWHYYFMAVFYIVAGIGHFVKPKWYLRVMPPFFPSHRTLVILSGVVEILLGIGLFSPMVKDSDLMDSAFASTSAIFINVLGLFVFKSLIRNKHENYSRGRLEYADYQKWS